MQTLIYLHIPKTGGTSLRRALVERIGEESTLSLYDGVDRADPKGSLGGLDAARLAAVRLVVGHLPHGVHGRLPGPARYITMLRDPLERVGSAYRHHLRMIARRTAAGRPLSKVQRAIADTGVDLTGFATGSLGIGSQRNRMTRLLAGDRGPRSDDPVLLEKAIENLGRDFIGVGLAHRSDRFATLLFAELGLPPIDRLPRVNRGPEGPSIQQLEASDRAAIAETHALDVALYEHVVDATDNGERLVAQER